MLGADRMEFEAEFAETYVEPDRKIGRHAETVDALLERREDDRVGDPGLRVRLAEIADDGREVQDFVEGGLLLGAADFHPGQQTDAPAAGRESRERVGGVEAAEPAQVGVLGRGRHHQHVADGRGGGTGGASHGRRMTEVGPA